LTLLRSFGLDACAANAVYEGNYPRRVCTVNGWWMVRVPLSE